MSGQGKQAKILSEAQIRAALGQAQHSRYGDGDRVMILLSVKAGLRAKEIASLTWAMVTDAEGAIGDAIRLTNIASKGKHGGRTNTALQQRVSVSYWSSMARAL
jgi:integrase